MSNSYSFNLPLSVAQRCSLKCGDVVKLTGYVYTARDAAHKRMCSMIENGEKLPIDLKGSTIYYCGPTPAPAGKVIGSCGPTTSGRMDKFAPILFSLGVNCTIGKGKISEEVKKSIIDNKGIYFLATGGAGALLSDCVKQCEVVAFEDLGPESIKRLYVENMPLIVGCDCNGNDIYECRNI